jgi:hypothetical protein
MDYNLFFLATLVLGVVGALAFTWGKGEAAFNDSLQQMQTHGYAVTRAREANRGAVTWVWGRYSQPLPWYLHFANRYPELALAERALPDHLTVGHAAFDKHFYLRTNQPDWARQFFTLQRCDELVGHDDIQFLTSAIGQILTPDYWPKLKERNLRDLWMLRISGEPEGADLERYAALALRLSADVQAFCQGRAFDPADLQVKGFEGF